MSSTRRFTFGLPMASEDDDDVCDDNSDDDDVCDDNSDYEKMIMENEEDDDGDEPQCQNDYGKWR